MRRAVTVGGICVLFIVLVTAAAGTLHPDTFSAGDTDLTATEGPGGSGLVQQVQADGAAGAGLEVVAGEFQVWLEPGESVSRQFQVSNTGAGDATVDIGVRDVDQVVTLDTVEHTVAGGASEMVGFTVDVPDDAESGAHRGAVTVSWAGETVEVPVTVFVESVDDPHLDIDITAPDRVTSGSSVMYAVELAHMGETDTIDAYLEYTVNRQETAVMNGSEEITVETVENQLYTIEEDLSPGTYVIEMTAHYDDRTATDIAQFDVETAGPGGGSVLFDRVQDSPVRDAALPVMGLIVALLLVIGTWKGYRRWRTARLTYKTPVTKDATPSTGLWMGQVADQGIPAYLRPDELTTHAIIAGATGAGKTVAAQVLVEELLEQGTNVIVLDPTGQWTGFLRDGPGDGMKEAYDRVGMDAADARGYRGNIRLIEDADEQIDMASLLDGDDDDGEGFVQVFSLHRLETKNLEQFVSAIIDQVFDAELEDRDHLETVIVFDEVHRLLEKYGGSGDGEAQVERGVREFRKWGIGMLLVSQVISDFSEDARSNIRTKIQLMTRHRDELEWVKTKYGIEVVQGLARADVGIGMFHNPGYNDGDPYFVRFRPVRHLPRKLPEDELDQYMEYNRQIDQLAEAIDMLEEEGEDVFSLRSELDLARKNLRKGSFEVVDIYINELEKKV